LIGEESPELVTVVRNVIHSDVGSDYPWPGNVRELEQAVRRILLTKEYKGDSLPGQDLKELIVEGIDTGDLTAQELLSSYCNLLYKRFGTYEEIARRTNLDRRTVKKYIEFSQGKAG
jgi:transcriptional regulator with PAS, ATPase and Fis domain